MIERFFDYFFNIIIFISLEPNTYYIQLTLSKLWI